jgi:hypothetical protein
MLVIFVCKELVVFNDEDLLQNLVVKIAGSGFVFGGRRAFQRMVSQTFGQQGSRDDRLKSANTT